jgi:hypothetical protein
MVRSTPVFYRRLPLAVHEITGQGQCVASPHWFDMLYLLRRIPTGELADRQRDKRHLIIHACKLRIE